MKNLLFDLGNVILDLHVRPATEAIKRLMRPDADRSVIDKIMLAYESGQVSDELFINAFLSQAQRQVQAIDVIEAWNSMLGEIPPHRLELLSKLKDNYKVYLLSNTNAIHLRHIHHYLEKIYSISDFENTFFHKAYYSHLLGVRKPSKEIFNIVIESTPLFPEETLYMDDLRENIEMAASMGFQVYLVEDGEDVFRNNFGPLRKMRE